MHPQQVETQHNFITITKQITLKRPQSNRNNNMQKLQSPATA